MRLVALCFAGLSAAGFTEVPAAPSPAIELRDDRGESITSPLSLCYRTVLRSDCVDLPAGEPFLPHAPLRSLRVEGPDHGPLSLQGDDLKAGADGRLRLRIPRKALLRIDKRPAEPLDIAVYDKRAATFGAAADGGGAVRKVRGG